MHELYRENIIIVNQCYIKDPNGFRDVLDIHLRIPLDMLRKLGGWHPRRMLDTGNKNKKCTWFLK